MEKGKYKCRLECGLCLDCTQLPSKVILGKGTPSMAVAVEEGNAALGHSTPRTYVTSAEMECGRMCTVTAAGWEAAARMLISAVLLSVQCGHSLVKKNVYKLKKKNQPCIKVKKQKYKSTNAAFFRAVIMN